MCDLLCAAAAQDVAGSQDAAQEQQHVVQQALKRLDQRAGELLTTAEQANANAARERGENDEEEDENERARKVVAALTSMPVPVAPMAAGRAGGSASAVQTPLFGAAAKPLPATPAATVPATATALDLNDLD